MVRRIFAVAGLLVLGLVGCSDDEPQANPTAQASATVTVAVTATVEGTKFHPADTTTGIAEVDAVIAATLAGDVAALRGLVGGEERPCGGDGFAVWPACPEGEPTGTMVPAFFGGACAARWSPAAEVMDGETWPASFAEAPPALHSVIRGIADREAARRAMKPAAEYWVIFGTTNGGGALAAAGISEGRLLSFVQACSWTLDEFVARHLALGTEYVLPPLDMTPAMEPPAEFAWAYEDEALIWPDSAALRAFVERDRELLASLADPVMAPCVGDPPAGPLIPPACPEGSPEGTPAPALLFGGCVESNPVDASIDYFLRSIDAGAPQHLYATVFHVGPTALDDPPKVIHTVILSDNLDHFTVLLLTAEGIAGIGGCRAAEMAEYLAGIGEPDWFMLPPRARPEG